MNAKNFFRNVFFVLMSVAVFASCSDDDNEPTPPPGEPTPKGMGMYISVDLSQDILSTADVYLQYIDGTGNQQVEKVESTSIRKTITTLDFSQPLGYRVLLKEKSANEITNSTYTMSYSETSVFAVIDTEGEVYSEKLCNSSSSLTIKSEKLSDWITRRAELLNMGYKVSADKKSFNSYTIDWDTPNFI